MTPLKEFHLCSMLFEMSQHVAIIMTHFKSFLAIPWSFLFFNNTKEPNKCYDVSYCDLIVLACYKIISLQPNKEPNVSCVNNLQKKGRKIEENLKRKR